MAHTIKNPRVVAECGFPLSVARSAPKLRGIRDGLNCANACSCPLIVNQRDCCRMIQSVTPEPKFNPA